MRRLSIIKQKSWRSWQIWRRRSTFTSRLQTTFCKLVIIIRQFRTKSWCISWCASLQMVAATSRRRSARKRSRRYRRCSTSCRSSSWSFNSKYSRLMTPATLRWSTPTSCCKLRRPSRCSSREWRTSTASRISSVAPTTNKLSKCCRRSTLSYLENCSFSINCTHNLICRK